MSMMDWMGQTIGQYRIEAPLDAGGMGQVFRGMHVSLNRPAAIKIMRADLADDPTFRGRFLQEAQAAAALHHPHIVEIYDFNEHNGHLYLVMELMTAGSLRGLLRRRVGGQPWSLTLGLDLMRQAAEGLAAAHAHAHAQGMVHRDIKPDNLLLNRVQPPGQSAGAEQYQLKIGDFGLAKMAAGNVMTTAGATMGTLAYMSPEQCQGGKLDGRSDLYSLGIVLYLVATGYHPFQINTFDEAVQKHCNVAPEPPRQQHPDIPAFVEEIIMRCLAKKPEDRYATGSELAQALRVALGDQGLATVLPIRLPSPPPLDPTVHYTYGAGQPSAPNVVSLPGISALPLVRVLDQSGQTLQVEEVTEQGIIIGRQSDSAIVLPEQAVSRQHLRVSWDGQQVVVTDLGSSNGTVLGEQRLQAQQSLAWKPGQMIHLGSYWLRLEGAHPQAGVSPSGQVSQTLLRDTRLPRTQQTASIADGGRIGVIVEPEKLVITPGQPALIQVTLLNMGTTVDWFTLTAEGVAAGLVQGLEQAIQLNPGMEQAVTLTVLVARTATNRAGDYPITILARSREKPAESRTARAHWTVLPFTEDALSIQPRRATGRGKAAYTVILRNDGNIQARHELSGDDDEQKLVYRFGQTRVGLEPGQEGRIPLQIETRRHWLGREQHQPFQIHARAAGVSSRLNTPGEFVNKAVLPGWVMPAVGVVLAASLVLVSLFALLPKPGSHPGIVSSPPPVTTQPTATSTDTATAQPTQPTPTVGVQATATAQAAAVAQQTAAAISTQQTAAAISTQQTATAVALSQLGVKWTLRTSGTSNGISGIAWSSTQSQFVAVGVAGTILTSADGIMWTPQPSGTSLNLFGITWSGTQFVAVGSAGTILTSADGITWTPQPSSGTADDIYGITWSNSRSQFVAVGNTGMILTSSDGITWTRRTSNTSSYLFGITWSGIQFVAVGWSDTILTSSDGITWTPRTSNTSSYFSDITWSDSLSQFVVVGVPVSSGAPAPILTSADGITWTPRTSNTSSFLYGITWSGTQFVAGGDGGTILTSPDGIIWTSRTAGTSKSIHEIIWSGTQFVAGGDGGTILTSP